MTGPFINDPVERIIANALTNARMVFQHEREPERLDFYIPVHNVFIECARQYTPRKIEQASRAENVIIVQGLEAAKFLAMLIERDWSGEE